MKLKLDFIKRILIDSVNIENVVSEFFKTNEFPSDEIMTMVVNEPIPLKRLNGEDEPINGYTMIGLKRLDNIHSVLDYVRENNIEGDIIETGVWRGGCCIFIKTYIKLYGMDKKVFVCDSFEGLPRPDPKYIEDNGDMHYTYNNLKVSLEAVKENFIKFDVLDDNVKFIKGWFCDTLKDNNDIGDLSILRFDGDMYGSTMDVLGNLYSKVSKEGVIVIDDYCLPNCKKAVTDFRNSNSIVDDINVIDRCGIWWLKK